MGSLTERRRAMMRVATPSLETASGQLLTWRSPGALPFEALRVDFYPIQAGSGDPSLSNVRPITGWTGLDVHLSHTLSGGTVTPVSWQSEGTVYGGEVDLLTGEITDTYCDLDLASLTWRLRTSSAPYIFSASMPTSCLTEGVSITEQYCDTLPVAYAPRVADAVVDHLSIYRYGPSTPTTLTLYLAFTDITTLSALNTWLAENHPHVCFRRASNITHSFTPPQITTLRGLNNLWTNSNGDTTATYWTI